MQTGSGTWPPPGLCTLTGQRWLWVAVGVQWAVNVVDIEGVIAKVGARVLGDPAVSEGVRASRAQGLRELGLIFRQMKARFPPCRACQRPSVARAQALTFKLLVPSRGLDEKCNGM